MATQDRPNIDANAQLNLCEDLNDAIASHFVGGRAVSDIDLFTAGLAENSSFHASPDDDSGQIDIFVHYSAISGSSS